MPTENMQVAQSSDDAEQSGAQVVITGVYIRWYQGSTAYGGFRFVPLANITQGADITTATFSYKYTDTARDTLTADIWGEDGAAPGTFTTGQSNISNRTPTTATTAIDDTDAGTDWVELDVTAIIQELADSYTIEALVIIGYDATSDIARMICWDGDQANCPKLDVVYTVDGADALPMAMNHYRRRRT